MAEMKGIYEQLVPVLNLVNQETPFLRDGNSPEKLAIAIAGYLNPILQLHDHRDVVLSRGFTEPDASGNSVTYQKQVAVCSVCGRVLDPFGVQGQKPDISPQPADLFDAERAAHEKRKQ